MRYRNLQTGSVIDVPCPVSGPDWEQIPEREKTGNTAAETPRRTAKKRTAKEPEEK